MPPVVNSITINSLHSAPASTPWPHEDQSQLPFGVKPAPLPRVDAIPVRTPPAVEDGWSAKAVTLQEAATLALLDTADLLASRGLALHAKPCPHHAAPACLRALLGAAIRLLLEVSLPSQDAVLQLSSGLSPGAELLVVHLDLAGGRVEGPGPLDSLFDETLSEVERVGGYLNIEWTESGTNLRLVIPLRTQ